MGKKTFLMTGGCGFIGSSLIRKLVEDLDNSIINIDKLTYASNTNSIDVDEKNRYMLYPNDINDDSIVKQIFTNHKPDFVIHLAAESHVDRSIDGPKDFINTNVLGTYSILNSSYNYWKNLDNKEQKSFRFINVSTDEVYGSLKKDDEKSEEENSYRPNSPYAASKASADHLCRAWYKTYNFPTIITNTTNNYGLWQFPEKLIPLVISKCLNGNKIPIYGNGSQIRDWIHVSDHVEGILHVLNNGKVGEKYNIGSNSEVSNIDLVKKICEILDKINPRDNGSFEELISFVADRPGHDTRYALNTAKMSKLGWKPRISIEKGLFETVKWYLNNQDFLSTTLSKNYTGERLGKIR